LLEDHRPVTLACVIVTYCEFNANGWAFCSRPGQAWRRGLSGPRSLRRLCGADLWGRHAAGIVVGCPRTDRESAPSCCRRFQAEGTSELAAAAAIVCDLCRRLGTRSAAGSPSAWALDDSAGKSGGGGGL